MKASQARAALGWTLGAGFLVWVGLTFDWAGALGVLGETRLALFLGISTATLPLYFLMRTLRWKSLLPDGFDSLLDRYIIVGAAVGLGAIAPFQAAEVLKVEAGHRNAGLARTRGYSALLLERCLDLAVILLLFCLCYPSTFPHQGRKVAWAMLVAAIGALVVLPWLGRLPGTARLAGLGEGFRSLLVSPSRILAILASTTAAWALVLAGWYGVLVSLRIPIHFAELAALMSGIALLGAFSLIPGGLGICELGITGMLALAGVEPARAQGAALLLRCYSMVSAVLGLLLLLWGRRRSGPGRGA